MDNQEQAGTVADHSASSLVSTRRHLVALVEAKFTTKGTRTEIITGGNAKWNRKFPKFQISRKRDNLERLTEISETNFRKRSVLFNFKPEFPEILVEWNAPNIWQMLFISPPLTPFRTLLLILSISNGPERFLYSTALAMTRYESKEYCTRTHSHKDNN